MQITILTREELNILGYKSATPNPTREFFIRELKNEGLEYIGMWKFPLKSCEKNDFTDALKKSIFYFFISDKNWDINAIPEEKKFKTAVLNNIQILDHRDSNISYLPIKSKAIPFLNNHHFIGKDHHLNFYFVNLKFFDDLNVEIKKPVPKSKIVMKIDEIFISDMHFLKYQKLYHSILDLDLNIRKIYEKYLMESNLKFDENDSKARVKFYYTFLAEFLFMLNESDIHFASLIEKMEKYISKDSIRVMLQKLRNDKLVIMYKEMKKNSFKITPEGENLLEKIKIVLQDSFINSLQTPE